MRRPLRGRKNMLQGHDCIREIHLRETSKESPLPCSLKCGVI